MPEKFRISKKYSFSLIAFLLFFLSIYFVYNLDYPLYEKLIITLALLLCNLVVTIAYLTGQAKIDVKFWDGK